MSMFLKRGEAFKMHKLKIKIIQESSNTFQSLWSLEPPYSKSCSVSRTHRRELRQIIQGVSSEENTDACG